MHNSRQNHVTVRTLVRSSQRPRTPTVDMHTSRRWERGAETMEYHVAIDGSDHNDGSASRPLRTISAAAQRAQPGDIVTVHEGTYREWISPPRGGVSDEQRIVYRAAAGGASRYQGIRDCAPLVARQAGRVAGGSSQQLFRQRTTRTSDGIRGDWFNPRGRDHRAGAGVSERAPACGSRVSMK